MFTGLIEEIGTIQTIVKGQKSATLSIKANKVLEGIKLGDSISTNGVCLTVTAFNNGLFTVDVMAETMRKSNLYSLTKGSTINLERALMVGDRLGGHIVSGHIDGIGTISDYRVEDNAVWITINTSNEILKYIVLKGSIAIDGVSLTVAHVGETLFEVSIIPHTKQRTTLLQKKPGDEVNLECDMLGKYIEKLMKVEENPSTKKNMDLDFLKDNGFI